MEIETRSAGNDTLISRIEARRPAAVASRRSSVDHLLAPAGWPLTPLLPNPRTGQEPLPTTPARREEERERTDGPADATLTGLFVVVVAVIIIIVVVVVLLSDVFIDGPHYGRFMTSAPFICSVGRPRAGQP